MKKEELVSKFMDIQKEYQMTVRNAKGKKIFAVLDFFANNIGGRVLSGAGFGVVGLLAAAPLGIFALIPMAAAWVLGFFVPKFVEKINLSLMGKFGNLYTKHYLASKAENDYAYYLICQKDLVNAENLDNVSKKDWKNFCKNALHTHYVYDSYLWQTLTKKIDKTRDKDAAKIRKIMKDSHFDADTKSAKVEEILKNHEKVLAPWCELKNECGKFASQLADCAKEFNPEMKMADKRSYFADKGKLRHDVEKYVEENELKAVEFDSSSLFEESNEKQNLTKYTSKDKENEKEEEKEFDKKMLN